MIELIRAVAEGGKEPRKEERFGLGRGDWIRLYQPFCSCCRTFWVEGDVERGSHP